MQNYIDYPINDGPLSVREIKPMSGANYFSGGPIVVIRLDLGEYDEVFTNDIPGFYEKLKAKLPSLYQHHCSPGVPGGFFLRVQEGTLLGHVTEHTAIELQTLAGMDVAYGKTRSTNEEGVYNVIFRFFDEVAGIYAGKAAVNLVNSLLLDQPFDVEEIVQNLIDIREKRLLGPSTQAIVDEAKKRKIPYLRLDEYNLIQLGTGKYQKRTRATITDETSLIAVETADNKHLTNLMLKDAGIPVQQTFLVETLEAAMNAYQQINAPVVIKPNDGYSGKGVSINLQTEAQIEQAFVWAKEFDESVLIEPFVPGDSYRILTIDYQFVAAVKLEPPFIVGDGTHTIAQLIETLNNDPERGIGDRPKTKLTKVEIDDITQKILMNNGYTLNTVLQNGEVLYLKTSGNLALGGSSYDVTDQVHPFNRFLSERASKVLGLNVAGIDVISANISQSVLETGGVFLEINAAPDFRMHIKPTKGVPRNVAKNLVELLFPPEAKTHIPIFSVTGTAGKTTTVNLLNHCLKLAGFTIGMTSTDGLFITDNCLMKGDMTYPEHVALVLKDPTIDCAILETSREGILRKGLGYEFADVGIFLNMHDEHVGKDDIKYIEDLAYAKSVVVEQVYDSGFSILNADNDLVMEAEEEGRIYSNLVLFSHSYYNERVRNHTENGGMAVVIDHNKVVILHGSNRIEVANLEDIPLSFGKKAKVNYDNILAAVAALYAYGVELSTIQTGITSYYPTTKDLPGRMNLMKVKDFDLLLDYAHSKVAFDYLKEFLSHFPGDKIGVIDAAGDRSDEEIKILGEIAAQTYDQIIFYEGYDMRGRESGEIINLLKQGARAADFPEEKITLFDVAEEAWNAGLSQGGAGKLVVILSPRAEKTLAVIEAFRGE